MKTLLIANIDKNSNSNLLIIEPLTAKKYADPDLFSQPCPKHPPIAPLVGREGEETLKTLEGMTEIEEIVVSAYDAPPSKYSHNEVVNAMDKLLFVYLQNDLDPAITSLRQLYDLNAENTMPFVAMVNSAFSMDETLPFMGRLTEQCYLRYDELHPYCHVDYCYPSVFLEGITEFSPFMLAH
jgi:hypothetical protein